MIKEEKLEEDETLVSYDVKALYPSVPQEDALNIIKDLLHQDKELYKRTPMKAESTLREEIFAGTNFCGIYFCGSKPQKLRILRNLFLRMSDFL